MGTDKTRTCLNPKDNRILGTNVTRSISVSFIYTTTTHALAVVVKFLPPLPKIKTVNY